MFFIKAYFIIELNLWWINNADMRLLLNMQLIDCRPD